MMMNENQEIKELKKECLYYKKMAQEGGKLRLREANRFSQVIRELKNVEQEHARKAKELERANISLKYILSQLEEEKTRSKENIALNLQKRIIPLLEDFKQTVSLEKLAELEFQLNNLSGSFYKKMIDLKYNLTPTEIEICDLVKSGHLAKEIAKKLNISYLTVRSHKKNIRKKLQLNHTSINLRTYLNEIS